MTFAPATGVQDIHGRCRPGCLAGQKIIIDNTFLYRTRLSVLFTKTTSYKEIKQYQVHESIDLIIHGTHLASQRIASVDRGHSRVEPGRRGVRTYFTIGVLLCNVQDKRR